jgi:hypothetical protein
MSPKMFSITRRSNSQGLRTSVAERINIKPVRAHGGKRAARSSNILRKNA